MSGPIDIELEKRDKRPTHGVADSLLVAGVGTPTATGLFIRRIGMMKIISLK